MAVPIPGLFNTGQTFTAGEQDTHYALSKVGGDGPAVGSYGYETSGAGFQFGGFWMPNTVSAQWLTPLPDAEQHFDSHSPGVYSWTLTFDLTGFEAATAFFSGRWATDNSGVIRLNGTTLSSPSPGFASWTAFSSAGGTFNSAINTLIFEVTNFAQSSSGNPTGVLVEFLSSEVAVTAIDEPPIVLVFLSGITAWLSLRRRGFRPHSRVKGLRPQNWAAS